MQNYSQKAIEAGIFHGGMLTLVVAFALQYYGNWLLMIPAGLFGGVFTRRIWHAFIAGFLGVACAWSAWFMILVATGQAYAVGEFFAGLIGLPGLGRYIVSASILIGGFLGASGAIVGRAAIESWRS
jgi:hypothetical protein